MMIKVVKQQVMGYCTLAIALVFIPTPSLEAVPIVIQNAGFENPLVDPAFGTTLNGTPIDYWFSPNYTAGGLWDIENYSGGYWSQTAPEGVQVLYVGYPADNYYEQTLSHVIQPNSTYKLTGFAGDPIGFQTTYAVQLRAGGNVLATYEATGIEGAFEQFEVQYDSTGSVFVGSPLTIRLFSGGSQTAFDNIKLDGPAADVVAGDYDGNQVVDGADFLWWQRVSGLSVDIAGTGADGNGNGLVDELDLTVWADHYGAPASVNALAVPEPCALAMAIASGIMLIGRLQLNVSGLARRLDGMELI